MQHDVAEAALPGVFDGRHARDVAGPLAVDRVELQRATLLRDEQASVGQERHRPRLVELGDRRRREGRLRERSCRRRRPQTAAARTMNSRMPDIRGAPRWPARVRIPPSSEGRRRIVARPCERTRSGCWSVSYRGRASAPRRACMPQERIAGRAEIIDGDSFEIGADGRAPVRRRRARRPPILHARRPRLGAAATTPRRAAPPVGVARRDLHAARRSTPTAASWPCAASARRILGAEMVRAGFATAYRRYSNDYVDEENEARAARRGIWAGEFTPPEDYRRDDRRRSAGAAQRRRARRRDRAATGATSKATSTAKASASTTCPARRRTTTPSSTRATVSAGSARKPKRAAGWRAPRG